MSDENKRKHLQMTQDIIARMGSNSFLLKGWSISLVTAIVGFALTSDLDKDRVSLLTIAAFLITMFWLLDAYYLSQERGYRKLYSIIADKNEVDINFLLSNKGNNTGYNSWSAALISPIFLVFYAPALFLLLITIGHLVGIDVYLK